MTEHHQNQTRQYQHPRLVLAGVIACLVLAGCNTSRYGISYDRCLPRIKTVAVVPAAIEVMARHTGGVMESRPDLEPDVRARILAEVRGVLAERGAEPQVVSVMTESGSEGNAAADLALLNAVQDAIVTHHYQVGGEDTFEYPTGEGVKSLLGERDADAVLMIYLTGVVPTTGRKILKGTAMAVSMVTGIGIQVSTDEAMIALMLVDAETGDVLWFNWHRAKADVQSERQLRKVVEKASAYLLEPRK